MEGMNEGREREREREREKLNEGGKVQMLPWLSEQGKKKKGLQRFGVSG